MDLGSRFFADEEDILAGREFGGGDGGVIGLKGLRRCRDPANLFTEDVDTAVAGDGDGAVVASGD